MFYPYLLFILTSSAMDNLLKREGWQDDGNFN
jgi:hypothetical protein